MLASLYSVTIEREKLKELDYTIPEGRRYGEWEEWCYKQHYYYAIHHLD